MRFVISTTIKDLDSHNEVIVESKEELMEHLFKVFSKLTILDHMAYLKNKGFSQSDFLRYGTLGTYSLFLVGRNFTDISELNYELSDISLNVTKLLKNDKISII